MITRELLRAWGACWSDADIADVVPVAGRSPRSIASDESVSLDDRMWVLSRAMAHKDEYVARCHAVESAALVALHVDAGERGAYCDLLDRILAIEDLPVEQRDAARSAARDAGAAAWDAARSAASAASAAAWSAASAAAYAAARSAASAAAYAAAYAAYAAYAAAAWDAELREAIDRAIAYLGDAADDLARDVAPGARDRVTAAVAKARIAGSPSAT